MVDQNYINFFKSLEKNNYKEWFDEHRKEYEQHVRAPFIQLIENLIPSLMEIEPSILPDAKKALFRINRDIRFSKDKTPYNVLMKASLSPGGKKSELPGFYLGIGSDYVHIGGGLYQLSTKALKRVRYYIATHSQEFLQIVEALDFKKVLGGLKGDKNKRISPDLQAAFEQNPYIANKQFYAMAKMPTSQFIKSDNQVEALMDYYKVVQPLHSFLNKALHE